MSENTSCSEDVTPEQVSAFEAEVRRLGLDLSTVKNTVIDTANAQDCVVIGGEESSVETKTLVVETLDALREAVGSQGQRPIHYPPSLPETRTDRLESSKDAEDIWTLLTSEDRENLPLARNAFLHGDPDQVASYKTLLERTELPQEVVVHAAESIVVHPDKPLVFRGTQPISAVYASVTVLPGGQIICETEVKIRTQVFKAA